VHPICRIVASLSIGGLGACAANEVPPAMHLVNTVPLGGSDELGGVAVDSGSHRVFAAHGTELTVIDGMSGAVVGRLDGLDHARAITVVKPLSRGAVTDASKVTEFDLATAAKVAEVGAGADSDATIYDHASNRLFVADGKVGGLAVFDAQGTTRLASVKLGGRPAAMAVDGTGKLFATIEEAGEIVRIDSATLSIESRWTLSGCDRPRGLAIDGDGRRLFAGCANAILLVVDSESGAEVARLPIGKGSDTVVFDPARKMIFSANREGILSVFGIADVDFYVDQGAVTTLPGARTMAVDTATGRLFLVTAETDPGSSPRSEKLLVMDPP